jgi:hypothetical protein
VLKRDNNDFCWGSYFKIIIIPLKGIHVMPKETIPRPHVSITNLGLHFMHRRSSLKEGCPLIYLYCSTWGDLLQFVEGRLVYNIERSVHHVMRVIWCAHVKTWHVNYISHGECCVSKTRVSLCLAKTNLFRSRFPYSPQRSIPMSSHVHLEMTLLPYGPHG